MTRRILAAILVCVGATSFGLAPLTGVETAGVGCTADVNGDGLVDRGDFFGVFIAFGACPETGSCRADVDASGRVDVMDLVGVLTQFGLPCSDVPPSVLGDDDDDQGENGDDQGEDFDDADKDEVDEGEDTDLD